MEVTVRTTAQLANVANLDPRITNVVMEGFVPTDPIRLPMFPSHVVDLSIEDVTLDGPVAFSEGLEILELYKFWASTPTSKWKFPTSLKKMIITASQLEVIDVRHSRLKELYVNDHYVREVKINMPEGLTHFGLHDSRDSRLPTLPSSLTHLTAIGCHNLEHYREASRVRITSLKIDGASMARSNVNGTLSFYDTFPEVRVLKLINVNSHLSEISLTHLRELKVSGSHVHDITEINAPNLEKLILVNSRPLRFRGNYADSVTHLVLKTYPFFPDEEDWDSLVELTIDNGPATMVTAVRVPWLPFLKRLTLTGPIRTNGVLVSSLREYKAAWGAINRKKGAKRQ